MSSLETIIKSTFGVNTDTSQAKALQQDALQAQSENNALLAQQISARRAKMGALGIDPDSGSSASVMEHLTQSTNAANRQIADDANRKIKENLTAQAKKNLKNLLSGNVDVGAGMIN